MPRIPRGPIDLLTTYTVIPPATDPPDPPEQDYYFTEDEKYTIWGVGLVTFGEPTAAQQAWIANPPGDLSTFPTDWVSFGYPLAPTDLTLWEYVTWVKNQVLLTDQGVAGADAWSIGGLTGTGTFYFSDIAVIDGTSGGETLPGTNAAETLNGLAGPDTLNGGGGSDDLFGGNGKDTLNGGDGPDRLWGGSGDDILAPGSDAAFIYIEGGLNRAGVYYVNGGAGYDTLKLDYSAATASQSFSAAQTLASPQVVDVEAVSITGSNFADFLSGSSGRDSLFGGAGFDYLSGGAGNDRLDAGAPAASSVSVIGPGGHSNADALSLDHLFTAGAGSPSVDISIRQVQTKVSEEWELRQSAGGFYSFTVAEAGDLASIAYTVDDEFGDIVEFHIKDANGVAVWDFTSFDPQPPPTITFSSAGTYFLEVVIFQQNPWDIALIDLTLSLEGAQTSTHNVLEGGLGNDTYDVYADTDEVKENFDEGTDLVRSTASHTLSDNVENLTLTGAAAINGTGNGGANVIIGNSAANVITGGEGADRLKGAGGADSFKYNSISDSAVGAEDRITDFGKNSGDVVDLSAIDADTNTIDDDPFTLVSGFSGQAGQAYSSYNSAARTTDIFLDVDGDSTADMIIHLTGRITLAAGDFIL